MFACFLRKVSVLLSVQGKYDKHLGIIWNSSQTIFEHRAVEAILVVLALHEDARGCHFLHVVKVSVVHLCVGRTLQEPRTHTFELMQEFGKGAVGVGQEASEVAWSAICFDSVLACERRLGTSCGDCAVPRRHQRKARKSNNFALASPQENEASVVAACARASNKASSLLTAFS
jgi:hypothetical protein